MKHINFLSITIAIFILEIKNFKIIYNYLVRIFNLLVIENILYN